MFVFVCVYMCVGMFVCVYMCVDVCGCVCRCSVRGSGDVGAVPSLRWSGRDTSSGRPRRRAFPTMRLSVFILLVSLRELAWAQRRRCVYRAGPNNAVRMEEAGNVSGAVQHCARTPCCMGYFNLVDGHLVPDLQGCNVVQMECPESDCFSSDQVNNVTYCVCNTDFCNANLSWVESATPSLVSQGVSCTFMVKMTAPLVALLVSFIIMYILYIIHRWQRLRSVGKSAPACDGTLITQCSCHRSEAVDLDIASIELQQVVGQGHFAFVWRGCLQGTPVAVKVFSTRYVHDFLREKEVYTLPLLDHAGIVRFLGAGRGRDSGDRLLVLELAVHGSLRSYLCKSSRSWACCVKLAQTLSQGLAFLHSDFHRNGMHKPAVAHGDLSSSNVVVRGDGSCALCDFGCSTVLRSCPGQLRLEQSREISQVSTQMGTLCYMPPEILEGCVNLGNSRYLLQADVYALGLLLWEVWTRCSELSTETPVPEHQLPYEAELGISPGVEELVCFISERRKRPHIPEKWGQRLQGFYTIKEVLEDCWDHDPEARLTSHCAADRLATFLP
ncbi:hypothetical protein AGOR_G00133100 [Albula goreensis]|uniref:Serine/threonine-protein kinase receptor n=1 Tax=Albula goreensis TaxID=1534307 RepID=A0A8T3D488_9TELE|nr:hypothetical protein AGOR_G00133100 [Albula goreensis]